MSHDTLLETLRGEGKLSDQGEFRLDRDKARQKMQKFQLRDPHHYVLEFVQAAHLLDADVIGFTIDADEMQMHMKGSALERGDLEDVYDAAFSSSTDPKTRALRHLAFGLNAAQAMEPSVVRVEVVQDARRVTLEIGPDGEQITEENCEPGDDRITIYLREKFRASHLVEFFRNLHGDLAEKNALRLYCAYSPRRIYLDEERISFGHQLPGEVVGQVDIETPHEHGVIGILPRGDEVCVTILQNGVQVIEHRMKADLVAARAIIESDRLTKNLSQSVFVEDEGWRTFVEQLLPSALHASIYAYVSQLSPDQIASHQDWLRMLCARLIPKAQGANDLNIRLRQKLRRLGDLLEALPRLTELLSSLPLWPMIDHGQTPPAQALVSIDEFIYADSGELRDEVRYTRRAYSDEQLEGVPRALYFAGGPPRLFALLCDERLTDISKVYDLIYERQQNKKLWMSRPWPDRPNLQEFPHQEHFDYGGIKATIAVSDKRREDAPLFLVKGGHLLRQRDLCDLGQGDNPQIIVPGGLALSFAGALPLNRRLDGVDADKAFTALVVRVVEYLPEFIAAHAHRFAPSALQAYLSHFLRGDVHKDLFEALGLDLLQQIGWLKEVAKRRPDSAWALVDHLVNTSKLSDQPELAVRARLELLGPIVDQALYEGLWGEALSLSQLADEYAAHGEVWVVSSPLYLEKVLEMANRAGTDRQIVRVDRVGEIVLERLFGDHLISASKRLFEKQTSWLIDDEEIANTGKNAAKASPQEQSVEEHTLETNTDARFEPTIVDAGSDSVSVELTDEADAADPVEPASIESAAIESVTIESATIESARNAPEENTRPMSATPPPLPDQTPEASLLRRLRKQLSEVRGEVHYLLDDRLLHTLSLDLDDPDQVARTDADGTDISPSHVATCYAKRDRQDVVALAFLGASVYTSINIFYEEITDSHEAQFLMRLAEHLERELASEPV